MGLLLDENLAHCDILNGTIEIQWSSARNDIFLSLTKNEILKCIIILLKPIHCVI